MKPEEQNITIAEACGWIKGQWPLDASCKKVWIFPEHIPNYYGDLNACHDAEMSMGEYKRGKFWEVLCEIMNFQDKEMIHATAPQRCEAFLKTIGKWREPTETKPTAETPLNTPSSVSTENRIRL